MSQVLYIAAHGGFAGQPVPLGGGAAIADHLCREWARTRPFDLKLFSPALLGAGAPSARDLVTYNEKDYGAFCRRFSEAATRETLRHDPRRTAVLVNDVSEGPDFRALHEAGFQVFTIWHVGVVSYISDIYLKGLVPPPALARWWGRLGAVGITRLAPRILDLIFQQERNSLEYSRAVIVPSAGLQEVIRSTYPDLPTDRVRVLGWGALPQERDQVAIAAEALSIRREFGVPEEARIVLCLSRISPEKGQDRLLRALLGWRGGPLWVFICGEPAFMQGERHMARLHRLAARLNGVEVRFPGYVMGLRKQGFLRLADVYAFPSRHESYGLTLMEALAAGLPAVCFDHAGARAVMRDGLGAVVRTERELAEALHALLADSPRLREMGHAARQYALDHPFSRSAGRLADWLSVPHTARTNAGPI